MTRPAWPTSCARVMKLLVVWLPSLERCARVLDRLRIKTTARRAASVRCSRGWRHSDSLCHRPSRRRLALAAAVARWVAGIAGDSSRSPFNHLDSRAWHALARQVRSGEL
jgi:hypothetical protein